MKALKIMILVLILIMSAGAVFAAENITDDLMDGDNQEILESVQGDVATVDGPDVSDAFQNDICTAGEGSFTNLTDEIAGKDVVDLTHDYTFNNETDNKNGIVIGRDNFVLNGNGRTIDANNQSRIFNITANNITLNNLILTGGNAEEGGAIYSTGTLILNNVTFIDNYATEKGGAVYQNATLDCNYTRFIDNYGMAGSSIYIDNGNLTLYNSYVTSNVFSKRGQIIFEKNRIHVENTTFINITASYTPALFVDEAKEAYIINSKFINLMANITAGALGVKAAGYVYIKDCEFINATSFKNGGAILADIAGEHKSEGNVTILDTVFKDAYSGFGGAYLQLGGNLLINNTEFTNNHAQFNGGAIYLSYTESEINNCTFTLNGVELNDQGYPTYGGAVFSDISILNIDKSKFINNTASAGNAIYAYDTSYCIKNSLFENNTNPIYTFFDKEGILDNNVYIHDDNVSTNNERYASIMTGQGMQLTLINNTVNVTGIPVSFDLRNYSLVTPVKDQGWMGACWTFGMTSALESALLKATGFIADFSENSMQNTMLRYSIYGTNLLSEGGMNIIGLSYLLSWLGAFVQDADTYDELGKISPVISTLNDFHVQDAMFVPNNEIPNGTQIKLAIMKYGALDVGYYGQSSYDEENPYYNPDTYAQFVNETTNPNHEVSIVGWDDNFPKEKFLITPPDNGAWIIKNSWDTDWGDNGYLYVSYYDKSFVQSTVISDYATAIIIENIEPYNKNYQYDLMWGGNFLGNPSGGNIGYYNMFEAVGDDLIAAVGTYFNEGGVNYTVEIYVNDDLKLTQEGVSPYLGYHTIKLNEYVPIRKGDVFKAVVTSNSMPYFVLTESRMHYTENNSFICLDGQNWYDCYDLNIIACLKVYTVAYPSFSELQEAIECSADNHLDLYCDYRFNNETDNNTGILIDRDNFIINGNGRIINGNNLSRIFNIAANNVTINDLILINANADMGGAIIAEETLTLNNVTFINNYASELGGAIYFYGDILNCNNSQFIDNYAESVSSIFVQNGILNLYNADITSKTVAKVGQIMAYKNAIIYVENTTFTNTTATYAPAIYLINAKARIIDSSFINLKADKSAGAISLKDGGELYIENCEFINTTSSKNAGAVYADIAGSSCGTGNVTILDSVFKDTASGFGGAYLQLGGKLLINNTEFINCYATLNGGAIYLSFTESEIYNCTFDSNAVGLYEGYPTYGGAIFSDISTLNIDGSRFFNNLAYAGNAIYALDNTLNIRNSEFENNSNAIYTDFDKKCSIDKSNKFNNDTVSTNNTFYQTIVVGEGLQLTLINNTINVDVLPSKFDLRDWGWVSPAQNQGWMNVCWSFGMTGVLESTLLKATGIAFNLSMDNMKTMMQYSPYGAYGVVEGGADFLSISYLLSWLGAIPYEMNTYDELGKIVPVMESDQKIHVQDIIFIPNNEIPNGTQIKLAIMKYGSLDCSYFGQSTYNEVNPYYNPETYAQYVNVTTGPNHDVSIIGWDDNFPKEKFLITPPGDGAWIIKNSWGPDFGDNGCMYVSYYDQSIMVYDQGKFLNYAATTIIENTVPYNKNYQYDITWLSSFEPSNGTVYYANSFRALDDDLIAGVGTYFNGTGVNYTVEIYVNDELILTQEGASPYAGYHTIKLNEYVQIKKGDVFDAVIKSNWVPSLHLEDTRAHYAKGMSFVSFDGETWKDAYDLGYIACLKVYTVADDSRIINNKNISVDYNGGKYFSVKVVTADGHAVAGAKVTFTINKKTKTVTTGKNGIAKIKITDVPKKYTMTVKYNGKNYKNTVTVKQVLKTKKVTVKKSAKKFTLQATLKINGKLVKGKVIKFKFKGKTYKAKTNKKGIAKVSIKKKVIKKLKKGKKYTVKVTYSKDTIKTTVNVK